MKTLDLLQLHSGGHPPRELASLLSHHLLPFPSSSSKLPTSGHTALALCSRPTLNPEPLYNPSDSLSCTCTPLISQALAETSGIHLLTVPPQSRTTLWWERHLLSQQDICPAALHLFRTSISTQLPLGRCLKSRVFTLVMSTGGTIQVSLIYSADLPALTSTLKRKLRAGQLYPLTHSRASTNASEE